MRFFKSCFIWLLILLTMSDSSKVTICEGCGKCNYCVVSEQLMKESHVKERGSVIIESYDGNREVFDDSKLVVQKQVVQVRSIYQPLAIIPPPLPKLPPPKSPPPPSPLREKASLPILKLLSFEYLEKGKQVVDENVLFHRALQNEKMVLLRERDVIFKLKNAIRT